jgi:hypothetical protein
LKVEEAYSLMAKSIRLKESDPFMELASKYALAVEKSKPSSLVHKYEFNHIRMG